MSCQSCSDKAALAAAVGIVVVVSLHHSALGLPLRTKSLAVVKLEYLIQARDQRASQLARNNG